MTPYFRPRRSMLYVPGCSTRYLNKSRTLKVDSVILDLGDPILVEAKVNRGATWWRRCSPAASAGAKWWSA